MSTNLTEVYCKFFGREAVGLARWQVVEALVKQLDPRELGMGLSREILHVACCANVDYPDEDVEERIVEAARLKATEVFEEHDGDYISIGDIGSYYLARQQEFAPEISAYLAASPV